jgi:hypothetical protein
LPLRHWLLKAFDADIIDWLLMPLFHYWFSFHYFLSIIDYCHWLRHSFCTLLIDYSLHIIFSFHCH